MSRSVYRKLVFSPILHNTKTPLLLSVLGFLTVVVVSVFIVKPAQAGFFSFLSKFLDKSSAGVVYNTQTVPLLRAPQSSGVAFAIGGTSINFVEGSSILPVVGPLGSVADVENYKLDQITTYTVREGDNLSQIANMFGIDVRTLYWANDLKRGDLIRTGDVLVILPISGLKYEIKEGDTIKTIAKKHKGDVDEIIAFNNFLPGDTLEVGVTIIIPNAELSPIPRYVSKSRVRGSGGPTLWGYFGRPISGGRRSQGLHGFNAVDLANGCRNPVFASAPGDVLVARNFGWNGGYGKYVVVAHPNGTQTVYAHLSSVLVSVGQYLPQGWNIGTVGTTGHSTGCHVHFEIRGARNPF